MRIKETEVDFNKILEMDFKPFDCPVFIEREGKEDIVMVSLKRYYSLISAPQVDSIGLPLGRANIEGDIVPCAENDRLILGIKMTETTKGNKMNKLLPVCIIALCLSIQAMATHEQKDEDPIRKNSNISKWPCRCYNWNTCQLPIQNKPVDDKDKDRVLIFPEKSAYVLPQKPIPAFNPSCFY